jgi:hypothetical protein
MGAMSASPVAARPYEQSVVARLLPVTMLGSLAILAVRYALVGAPVAVIIVCAAGLLWLWGDRRSWRWAASAALATAVGMTIAGVLLGLEIGLMLLVVTLALSAWDLDDFAQRLRYAGATWAHERAHLLRLAAADIVGLAIGAIALGVRIRLNFVVLIVLGILAIVALGWVIGFVRRANDAG